MISKPVWLLYGEELARYQEESLRRQNEASVWRNSPASRFLRDADKAYPHVYGYYRSFEHKALVQYERSIQQLSELDTNRDKVVLIRLIYVLKEERGKGVSLNLIRTLTNCAERTQCCLIAVCNPFERYYKSEETETVETVAEYFTESTLGLTELTTPTEYIGPQQRMGERFKQCGFTNINIEESIGNRIKCTPKHCWIYIPESCDRNFSTSLTNRLMN